MVEITDAMVEAAIAAAGHNPFLRTSMRAALSAALAAGVAPGVKVKALVWVEEVADLWWSADCYRIEVSDGGGFAARVRQPRMHVFTTLAFGVSFEAAKAAAQADYEARVLSALEPAPSALVAEPAPVAAPAGEGEPFAFCCASFDIDACDCVNKNHGTARRG